MSRIDDYFYLCGPVFKITCRGNFKNPWAFDGIILNAPEVSLHSKTTTSLLMTLKIISYFTLIIPLIMFLARYLLRFPYHLALLSLESSILQKTTKQKWLFQNDLAILESLLPKVLSQALKKAPHPSITCYHTSSDGISVFEMKECPHLIFKTSNDNHDLKTRIKKMRLIKKIIKENNYDKLICPQSHLLQISLDDKTTKYCIIERNIQGLKEDKRNELGLSTTPDSYGWLEHDKDLRPAIMQFTQMIQKTGLSNIYHRNFPAILENDTWKICLLNTIIFRSYPSMVSYNLGQLINCCFSLESIDAVIDASNPKALPKRLQEYFSGDLQKDKQDRLKQL